MHNALYALGCELHGAVINEPPVLSNCKVPGYSWIENVAEDDVTQRAGYMSYLNEHLATKMPTGFHLVDVATRKTLLSFHDLRLPFNITGGTDVLISEIPDGIFLLTAVKFSIELKKEVQDFNFSEAIGQLISADAKADSNHPVIGVLTDLNNRWIFCWFTEGYKICGFELKEPKNAFDFIIHILNQPPAADIALPFNDRPLKQVKLNSLRPPVVDLDVIDQYESLEFLKNDELDENELRSIEEQQKRITLRLALNNPIFHSIYTSNQE